MTSNQPFKALVLDSGVDAEPINPYTFKPAGVFESLDDETFNTNRLHVEFNQKYPASHLTEKREPGSEIEVVEVWQYLNTGEWCNADMYYINQYDEFSKWCINKGYEHRKSYQPTPEPLEVDKDIDTRYGKPQVRYNDVYGPSNDNYGRDKKPWDKVFNDVELSVINDFEGLLQKHGIYEYDTRINAVVAEYINSAGLVKITDLRTLMKFISIPDYQINKLQELIKALPKP